MIVGVEDLCIYISIFFVAANKEYCNIPHCKHGLLLTHVLRSHVMFYRESQGALL